LINQCLLAIQETRVEKDVEVDMQIEMTFQQNISLKVCPLGRVEFNVQSVNFETGFANSPLETCLNYGCIFADDSNHLSENFCKCPEDLNPYEANTLEKKYLYLNKYRKKVSISRASIFLQILSKVDEDSSSS